MHGSAYEFLRNSFFDARNYFDPARIPGFQRNDFGASLGGPIRKDKLFLFANYEGYRQNLGVTDVTLVPDNNARNGLVPNSAGALTPVALGPGVAGLLNLWPVQNGPELLTSSGLPTGIGEAFSSAPQHIREDFGTARFDANLTPNDLLFAVYTIDDSTAHTPTQNPLSLVDESLREQVGSIQEQHVFSPQLLNTARFGVSRANFFFLGSIPASIQAATPAFLAGRPTGAVVISGSTASNGASTITAAGANVGSNNATTRNLFTFDDHIFWTHGRQQIEADGWTQLARIERQPGAGSVRPNQLQHPHYPSSRAASRLYLRAADHRTRLARRYHRGLCGGHHQAAAQSGAARRRAFGVHRRVECLRTAKPCRGVWSLRMAWPTPTPASAPPRSPTTARSSCLSRASASPGTLLPMARTRARR